MWYLHYTVSDKRMKFECFDSRVVVGIEESKECGNIGLEVFKYAFIQSKPLPKTWLFPILLYKEKGFLETNHSLGKKTDSENLDAIKFAIKTYKHIPKRLLSLGVIPELKNDKERFFFYSILDDISERQKLLEYKFLNNVNAIESTNELILSSKRKRKYYHGSIELNFLELIQQLFKTALLGNIYSKWMLNFSSPFHIWLIYEFQNIYLMWLEIINPINKRKHYQKIVDLKQSHLEQIKNFHTYNIDNNFTMNEGLYYTTGQLIASENLDIKKYYENYLESIKKQAYLIGKSKECKSIAEAYEYYLDYKNYKL